MNITPTMRLTTAMVSVRSASLADNDGDGLTGAAALNDGDSSARAAALTVQPTPAAGPSTPSSAPGSIDIKA